MYEAKAYGWEVIRLAMTIYTLRPLVAEYGNHHVTVVFGHRTSGIRVHTASERAWRSVPKVRRGLRDAATHGAHSGRRGIAATADGCRHRWKWRHLGAPASDGFSNLSLRRVSDEARRNAGECLFSSASSRGRRSRDPRPTFPRAISAAQSRATWPSGWSFPAAV